MSAPEIPWSIRAGLRLLPRSYREHRAAEIRATLADAGDAGRISVSAETIALFALSIRVRGRSLLAPPSRARARAAAIAAVVLPVLLLVPAARAIDLGLPVFEGPSGLFWRLSALVPAWIVAALAGLLTLLGAGRWAHRSSIAANVLFIGGLLVLVTTTDLDAAVREFGWLPLLGTSAALNRDPRRVRDGRRLLGSPGLAIVAVVTAGAAVAYVATGPLRPFSLSASMPGPLGFLFHNSRLLLGGLLLLICLVSLASRTARAAVPVVAALGMVYVGAALEANLWPNSDLRYTLIDLPVGHLLLQLVAAPMLVFAAARAMTALVDRAAGPTDTVPLTG
ncbi:hypothetical protein ABLG96_20025 [Nakamurella sp. A5-74]|uniref:ABC transporter permease n=1 Tax=Nakamurella sp. A5-74 TaxID=3158264 RepID=A0AAU8DMG1_9ACTN